MGGKSDRTFRLVSARFVVVGLWVLLAHAAGVGFLGLKLKDFLTLVKVEVSEKIDTVIETVTDPFQITGYEEKAKFLSDWNACRAKYPKGTWFRTTRVSACMLGKGWTSEIIGEGLEAALRKL